MPEPLSVSREVARRFLALHHLLAPPRDLPASPTSVERVVARLGSLQFDPIGIAGRNHDLVLHARVAGYRPAWTEELLYHERRFYETHNKALCLVPMAELPYYRIAWQRAAARHARDTWTDHGAYAEHILARIAAAGPLGAADFEQEPAIDWYWRPTNRARAILEALWEAGVIGLARREGNRRLYDLAERVYPPELMAHEVPERDQLRHKLLSRYRAHGLLGPTGNAELWSGIEPRGPDGHLLGPPIRPGLLRELLEADTLRPVTIAGLPGSRFILTEELAILARAEAEVEAGPASSPPGVAFLAPLDPLVWDRRFLAALYDFEYVWEVYVPAPKRRWGYYVLPLLFGDRLVGRIEPRIDRRARRVTIAGLWFEPGFDARRADGFVPALRAALADHLAFAESSRLVWGAGLGGWARRIGHPRPSTPGPPALSPRP